MSFQPNDPLAGAREIFYAEAEDMLQSMEDCLLRLEQDPHDPETMNALFRAVHTIKGSGGLFELYRVVGFAHLVENVLDHARNGRIAFDGELIALLLRCGDQLAALLEEARNEVTDENVLSANTTLGETLGERLAAYLQPGEARPAPKPSALAEVADAAPESLNDHGGPGDWHISARFGRDVFRNGMDPMSILRYLGNMGRIKRIVTLDDTLPPTEGFDPESCYLGFEISIETDVDKQTLASAFDFVRDDCSLHILPPNSKAQEYLALIESLSEDSLRLGEILVRCGCLTEQELQDGLARQKVPPPETPRPLGEILLEQQAVQIPVLNAALEKQQKVRDKQAQESLFIRIRAEKLDRLINLVGELVVAGAGVSLRAQRNGDDGLLEAAQTMAELVEQIRDDALQLRMVQIAETFNRFNRVVRDTSRELGKDIVLEIEGGENELDKSMVEKLVDPLTHLVRNAIDHGIESPEAREAAGKPAQGRVTLAARHESGSFVIEVRDDGGGLRRERILQKAQARGLIPPGKTLSDAEIFQFIFHAGFSTAEAVTNLSGRGVGMDVVRRNIEALRGSIGIDSVEGQGTCITMRLPLTLAIIDGFLVGMGSSQYVIPLEMVVECVELAEPAGTDSGGRNFINLRGEVLPFLRLREAFDVATPAPERENVVVVQYGTQRAGLVVDTLLGEFQTVIKPLSRLFASLRGISGSTILGSGEVALILDVPSLIQRSTEAESRALKSGLSAH